MVRTRAEIEAMIVHYLSGESTPEQAMELEDWLALSSENRHIFEELEQVFALTNGSEVYDSTKLEAAWAAHYSGSQKTPKVIPIWRNARRLALVASLIGVAFLLGTLRKTGGETIDPGIAKNGGEDKETYVVASSAHPASFTLQDNSTVVLSSGSSLTLDKGFNRSNRSVDLVGSGKFEVIHSDTKPFIIHVSGLQVVDLGTVFSIDSKEDTVKITVSEGLVELRLNGETLKVAAGDSAFYQISQQVVSRYKSKKSRQDHIFEFNGTNLEEVVSVLGEFFHRKIVIMDPAIAKCPVSVTFKNEDLPTILDIIRELLDVKIVRNKDIIGIYGDGCN